ncbi:MAG TPA: hypothetical protein PLP23_18105 [Panacibacter sp.]|nr:hypothetical protein [Panacibacter sp.]
MRRLLQITPTIFLFIIFNQLFAQSNQAIQIDTSIYSYQTVIIEGKKFTGFLTSNGFQLLNSKNGTYLKHSGEYFTWNFKDFNKDGYKDIYLDKGGNTPEWFDLLLYVPTTKSFRQVKDFEHFPAPERISGTKYFYSYHKSGCADMDWDSDLFYIKDFKAIRLANISGRECENSGIKDGLYINKLRGEKKILFKVLAIDTVHAYKEDKWGFIKAYWTKNHKLFL